MAELLTPEYIPTTGRNAEALAQCYGKLSLEQLMQDIPKDAVVVDVGAGLSHLGHDVARRRPDVRWINIDASYDDPVIRDSAVKDAPANLEFMTADVTHQDGLRPLYGKVDRVYSFWLLPHLSLQTEAPARTAVAEIFKLLNPGGKLLVGPAKEVGQGLWKALRYKNVAVHDSIDALQTVVEDVVARTKLWWLPRTKQLFINRYRLHRIGIGLAGGKPKSPPGK